MKKYTKAAIIISAVIITILIFSPYIINDVSAAICCQRLESELPEDCIVLDKVSSAGRFWGNGNGIQYLAAVAVSWDKSAEELDAAFDSGNIAVRKLTSYKSDAADHGEIVFSKLKDCDDLGSYYMVYSCTCPRSDETGLWKAFLDSDIRGH